MLHFQRHGDHQSSHPTSAQLASSSGHRRCFANVSLSTTTGQHRRESARWDNHSLFIPTKSWPAGSGRGECERMEPGEAVKAITKQAHPFTIAPEWPSALEEAVIRSFRIARMEFGRAAHDSFPGIMKEIESIKDQPLKKIHAQKSAERTATRSRSGEPPFIVGLSVQALRIAGRTLHDFDAQRLSFGWRD